MVSIPNNHEEALDIVWACIHDYNDRWDKIFPGQSGCTRRDIEQQLGWSYSTVHRLVMHLEKLGQVVCKWTHAHQSYWEGHFRNATR